MSWEGFMQMERTQLWERREGKLRKALGLPLSGETKAQLERIAEQDRRTAEQGLVAFKGGEGGRVFYKHIDDLGPLDMRFVIAAEWVEVAWLKERVERRKKGTEAPTIPYHLR